MSEDRTEPTKTFLSRCAYWRWRPDGLIELCESDGSPIKSLDDWQTLVFNGADGSNTVSDLARELSQSHPRDTYEGYLVKISTALKELLADPPAVELRQIKDDLPEQFDQPLESHETD